ncbi:hypothetical protein SNEBB_006112 [Seison nebaliae]|nr:hypothetical protein SNEBB_006112 [Seison nebaliae]
MAVALWYTLFRNFTGDALGQSGLISSIGEFLRCKLIQYVMELKTDYTDGEAGELNAFGGYYHLHDIQNLTVYNTILIRSPYACISFNENRYRNRSPKSSPVVPQKNTFYLWAVWILSLAWVQSLLIFLILYDGFTLAINIEWKESRTQTHRILIEVFEVINILSLVTFTILIIIRLIAKDYFSFWFDYIDIIITPIYTIIELTRISNLLLYDEIDLFPVDVTETTWKNLGIKEDLGFWMRLLHILRPFRLFRLLYFFPVIQSLSYLIRKSFHYYKSMIILIGIVIVPCSVIAMNIFSDFTQLVDSNVLGSESFSTFGHTIITLFQFITGDRWLETVQLIMDKKYFHSYFLSLIQWTFLVVWIYIGHFLFKNFFLGITITTLQRLHAQYDKHLSDEKVRLAENKVAQNGGDYYGASSTIALSDWQKGKSDKSVLPGGRWHRLVRKPSSLSSNERGMADRMLRKERFDNSNTNYNGQQFMTDNGRNANNNDEQNLSDNISKIDSKRTRMTDNGINVNNNDDENHSSDISKGTKVPTPHYVEDINYEMNKNDKFDGKSKYKNEKDDRYNSYSFENEINPLKKDTIAGKPFLRMLSDNKLRTSHKFSNIDLTPTPNSKLFDRLIKFEDSVNRDSTVNGYLTQYLRTKMIADLIEMKLKDENITQQESDAAILYAVRTRILGQTIRMFEWRKQTPPKLFWKTGLPTVVETLWPLQSFLQLFEVLEYISENIHECAATNEYFNSLVLRLFDNNSCELSGLYSGGTKVAEKEKFTEVLSRQFSISGEFAITGESSRDRKTRKSFRTGANLMNI